MQHESNSSSNPFALMGQQLQAQSRLCLEAICCGHGRTLAEMETASQAGPLRAHLRRLIDLDLVVAERARWKVTWLGWGVYHWNQQLLHSHENDGAVLSQPRPEENGEDTVPGCQSYRPLHSRPGLCWCGHLQTEHANRS